MTDPAYWDEWLAKQTEEFVTALAKQRQREVEQRAEVRAQRAAAKTELADVKQELANLVEAIGKTGFNDTLQAALETKEVCKTELERQLVVVPVGDAARFPELLSAGAKAHQRELAKLKD